MKLLNRAVVAASLAVFLGACGSKSEDQHLAAAQAMLAKRDVNAAFIEIKNALEKNPDSAAARLLLGKTLLRSGDAAAALIELSKAGDAGASEDQVVPEMARALLAQGETAKLLGRYGQQPLKDPRAGADLQASLAAAYAAQGDFAKAQDAASRSLSLQADNAAATLMRARLDAAEGKGEQALAHLDGLLQREPGNEAASLLKSEVQRLVLQRPDAALATLTAAAAASPDSAALLSAMVDLHLQQAQLPEARKLTERLKAVAPKNVDTQRVLAQLAYEDKDYKGCREITTKLLAMQPGNTRLLLLAAAAEYQLQQDTLAQGLLGRVLKVEPGHLAARHLLARSFLRTEQAEKALEALQPVLESGQPDTATLGLAGEAYLQLGDSRRAEVAFERAAKLAPADVGVQAALAMARVARGDGAAALNQLEALAKGDRTAQADQALITARLQQRDFKGALQAIDNLQRKLPEAAFPQVLKGRVLAAQNDAKGATAAFQAALAKDASSFAAAAGLAAMEYVGGQSDQARQRYLALIKAQPKDPRPRLALAELESRLGAPESKVLALLRDAVKADPAQIQPHLALVERLLAAADGQSAQIAAQEAAAARPDAALIQEALGRAQMAAGDFQRAVSSFKQLASMQRRDPLPLVRLAEAHLASNEPDAAQAALRKALELAPDSLIAPRGQARLYVASGRQAQATEIARGIQRRSPKDPFGFALEGEVAVLGKDWPAAANAYQAALQRSKLTEYAVKRHQSLRMAGRAADADRAAAEWLAANPKDAQFHFYLGDAYVGTKDWPKAEAAYRAVVALRPQHASALNNIAWLMATQRKPGAAAMAERALALLPDRAPYLDTLAFALEAEQQVPKAIEAQKRAVALDPKDHAMRWRLAQLQLKGGDTQAARKELETLAGLGSRFPGHAEVAAALSKLR